MFTNDSQPLFFLRRIREVMAENGITHPDRVGLYGMTYKENVDDHHRMVLITGHRRENFGKGFAHAFAAIKVLLEKYPDVAFVYPVHPNPNVRQALVEALGDPANYRNLKLIPPPDYPDFVQLMAKCTLVLTDSGGIQEEAPALGKPVLVMRDTSERPEAIAAGTARLVGTDDTRIIKEVSHLLDDPVARHHMSRAINPYGDGKACQRILEALW